MKSSVDEIRARFDADVERFSDPKGGQASTMYAAIALDMRAVFDYIEREDSPETSTSSTRIPASRRSWR